LTIRINACIFVDVKDAAARFRLLGDEARLRILRLLREERLNVTELTGILGIAQSGISRHLRLLKEAGFVDEERDRGYAWFRASEAPELGWIPEGRPDDLTRLQEILRHRQEEFREHGTEERQLVPGRSWAAWARALGRLLPPLEVADLGCGEGYLAVEISRWARRVFAVDRSRRMLGQAAALARRKRAANIVFRKGEIEKVPLVDGSVDVVLLSQALHHAKEPARALREAHRILRPGGSLLVLDLKKHRESWVRERLGDVWLGFTERGLRRLLRAAGFTRLHTEIAARRRGDPFKVLAASGLRV
jgi:ArsR family transcriptional regulator